MARERKGKVVFFPRERAFTEKGRVDYYHAVGPSNEAIEEASQDLARITGASTTTITDGKTGRSKSFGTGNLQYGERGSPYFRDKGWTGGNSEGDPKLS